MNIFNVYWSDKRSRTNPTHIVESLLEVLISKGKESCLKVEWDKKLG